VLQIDISEEFYNEELGEFVNGKPVKLQLEHSLVSISKWEAKWCRPFLQKDDDKTDEESMDYIRCMTITQNVDPSVYDKLTKEHVDKITEYIQAPMTATWFSKEQQKRTVHNSEKITSELIYYWMIAYTIPMECQKWHINRLLTLIQVCDVKNTNLNKC